MRTKLLSLLFLLFPISLFSQNYEKEGDDLFAQAQYEHAEKKYKAAIALVGESQTIKQKQEKCTKCRNLLAKAQTAEKESRYSDAAKHYSNLYAIHSLAKYQSKASAMKKKAHQVEQERLKAKNEGHLMEGHLDNNISWEYYEGILTIYGKGSLECNSNLRDVPWYGIKEKIKSVQLSNMIIGIGDGMFFGCTNLRTISIPKSITKIGNYAFADCRSMQSINIPNSVNEIGAGAFNRCYTLSITLPKRFNGKVDLSDCKSVTYY